MMKKCIGILLVICLMMILLVGCSANVTSTEVTQTTDEKQTAQTSKTEFEKFTKVADMLYEVTYDDYSSLPPNGSEFKNISGDMACSGVRNGDFVGRNFDFVMNQSVAFVVRTTSQEGRYATIGIGRLANVNSEMVEGGLSREKMDLLPWSILDGMNEKGLVVNSNVLFKSDWGEIPHTGTNPEGPELNALYMQRALLDNCATAEEAIEYIKSHNITPMAAEKFDLHVMVSDPQKTYVVEFINNEVVAKEQNIMTNYFVNLGYIPEHPDGLERMRILKDNYSEGSTMEGMYKLMQRVKYSNTYVASNKWYSELGFTYSQIQNVGDEMEEALLDMQKSFEEEMEYVKENGYRENTSWWITSHTSVYDIKNRKMWITVRERYDEKPIEYELSSSEVSKESENNDETSEFTANIDKYWQEHDIESILKLRNSSEEDIADRRAEMLKLYGENKEITGEFDENLAAQTASGTYVGKIDSNNVISWKGIPYAKQPVGELRWRAPEKPENSDKVYEAYYFGKSSVQVEGGDEPSSLYPQGEDCLNINLWKNSTSESDNKPIMVWIHGGAYIQGGACTDEYDGTNFVINNPDVIYASIDYRTDFMGFINLSNVPGAEEYKDSANLGLLDEIQALSWLKENAKSFGGDPERITIFGESAGGGSVSSLTLAPQAKDLFKRCIMQSGVSSGFLRTAEKSIEHTDKIMKISGANDIDDLKSLSISDIRKIETIIGAEDGTDYTYPQCDGIVVPFDIKETLESDQRNGIDIMIGTTKDEYNYWTMLLGKEGNLQSMRASRDRVVAKMNDDQKARFKQFMSMQEGDEYNKLMQYINYIAFHSPSRFEARTHADNGQNVYVYYFTEESKDLLSCHGYDLGFVLGNVEKERAKDIDAANRLSNIMQKMWVNFALTGDPSLKEGDVEGVGEIKWDKFKADDYKVMIFNAEESKQENDPLKEQNDLVEDLFWLKLQNK